MIGKEEFMQKIAALKAPVLSKTGKASYSNMKKSGNTMTFKRDNTNEIWSINLYELFEAYSNLDKINTVNIRKFVGGRVYSPACAFLIASKLYDKNGNKC